MRGYLLVAIMLIVLPIIPFRPYFGVLVWQWFSIMNPHRLVYGEAAALPYGLAIGGLTLLAVFLSRARKRLPFDWTTILILGLLAWTYVTTINALIPIEESFSRWWEFAKAVVLVLVTYTMMSTRKRLEQMIWTVVLSIALLALKGAVWVIFTGGSERVYGPSSSSIADNNDFGVALLLFLPLLFFLHSIVSEAWIKLGLKLLIASMVIAVLFTYSRGAAVGLFSLCFLFWWRSRHKIMAAAAAIVIVGMGVVLIPSKWFDRISTIETYQQDASAMSRILFWRLSIAIGEQRLLGGGFRIWNHPEVVNQIAHDVELPLIDRARAAHSIYFEALSEHGFPGLLLFLALMIVGWRNATALMRVGRRQPELYWAENLGRLAQISLIAFFTAGAFASLSFYDGYYTLLVIIAAGRRIANSQAQAAAGTAEGEPLAPSSVSGKRSPQVGTRREPYPPYRCVSGAANPRQGTDQASTETDNTRLRRAVSDVTSTS